MRVLGKLDKDWPKKMSPLNIKIKRISKVKKVKSNKKAIADSCLKIKEMLKTELQLAVSS